MRIMICVEDSEFADELEEIVKRKKGSQEVWIEKYGDRDYAMKQSLEKFDLAIIGTVMNKKDGFELGKRIVNGLVIYVMNDVSDMSKAFRYNAFQLIPKEMNEYVESEIQRALITSLKRSYEIILHLENGKDMFVKPIHFQYIEFQKNRMVVVGENKRLVGMCDDYDAVKMKLKDLNYFQMSCRYFVNMKYIFSMEKGKIYMRNGDCLKTSLLSRDVALKVIRKSIT